MDRIPDVAIRPFSAPDADEVSALIRETLLRSNAEDYPADVLQSLAEWYSAPGLISRLDYATRIVAIDCEKGRIVGTAARRENRVEGFFVHPDWQGRGIGRALLDGIEEDGRADALRVLWVESSLTAVGFYEGRGYTQAGPAHDYGDGFVVPLRKPL